jgi:outer membrane protein TolC
MFRRATAAALLLAIAGAASAQDALSLSDAIGRALATHPSVRAAEAAGREAESRVDQAQAGWFPRIDIVEGWQRGNQPVFVFSSLLSQRQFTAANFAIDALNHPDPVSNFRFGVGLQQPIFDGLATMSSVKVARTGVAAAEQQRALVAQELAVGVTTAYGHALRAEAETAAAAASVAAAEEDLKRVRARRDAGLATEADALAVQVHLAESRARHTSAQGASAVARAQLNELVGAPLDARFTLAPAAATDLAADDLAALEAEALASRPELKLAALQVQGAEAGVSLARAALLPHVAFQSGWEFNGGSFSDRASSWIVGTEVRFNLFRGGGDAARVAESRAAVERLRHDKSRAEQQTRLAVRTAQVQLQAARARATVGREARAQAAESQRIVRDRYEAGLEDITSLLRAAQAVQQADALDIAARVDVLVAEASLERALGRLPR